MQFDYNQDYLFFDLETDGLNLRYTRAWEIAYVEAKGKKHIRTTDKFIDVTDLKISPEVQRVTNFSWSEYNRKKQDPSQIIPDFLNLLLDERFIIVGQNLFGYEVPLMGNLFESYGMSVNPLSYIDRIVDTMALSKAYKLGLEPPRNVSNTDFCLWQMKVINDSQKIKTSQGLMLKEFGIEHDKDKLHRADYDCEMCHKLFIELIQRLKMTK